MDPCAAKGAVAVDPTLADHHHQLKFEEDEDIFSKYLPWAIIFELADRWAKICADLVAMGRLPNETPYWYIGNYQLARSTPPS
jgi:hypothetical protein